MKVITTYDTPIAKDALANNLHYKAMFGNSDDLGDHIWLTLKKRGIIEGEETSESKDWLESKKMMSIIWTAFHS